MSTKAKGGQSVLTEYESQQVREIAAWKAMPPNAFAELFKRMSLAVSDLIERIIPDQAAQIAIEKLYSASEMLAIREDMMREAGVRDLAELRKKPLEDCDRLAMQVGSVAQVWATIEGAATGAGGVLTTLIDVPLLFVLALRTIMKIGHSYGYPLDRPTDQSFVLAVMIAGLSDSLVIKQNRLKELRQIERLLLEETQEEIVAEEALALLFQLEIFEVPGIGAISGALLNLAFIHRVENTARRVFQERWLRDNGKVERIEPLVAHDRHLAPGWSGALGRAAYTGCYSVSFAATLPAWVVISMFRPVNDAVTRRVGDTARNAIRAAGRLIPSAGTAARTSRNGLALASSGSAG
jgi:EcsC protein family